MTVKVDPSALVLRKRFGTWLKTMREDAGKTQLDIATYLNYGYTVMVSQIERGVSALPEHDLLLWAEALNVPAAEFASRYLYYYRPYIFEALYGKDPYVIEKLSRAPKTIGPAPGNPHPSRAHRRA
jgi:transcriptional regulator with XRE-family HTH domain